MTDVLPPALDEDRYIPPAPSICMGLISAYAEARDCEALRRSLVERGASVHEWPPSRHDGPGAPPANADALLIAARILDVRVAALIRQLAAGPRPYLILVSDTEDVTDRILALELGADDLVRGDCDPRELIARIRAMMRRDGRRAEEEAGRRTDREGADGWVLNEQTRTLTSPSGAACVLSRGDVELINAVVSATDGAFAADADATMLANRIRVSISRLRRRIGRVSLDPFPIRNVWGHGYVFDGRLDRIDARSGLAGRAA